MPDDDTLTIRWVWAFDVTGRRCTYPEAVGFRWCDTCGVVHPVPAARGLQLELLPGRAAASIAGQMTSEFYPDDDA